MFLFNCTAALCRGSQPLPLASSKAGWYLAKLANASSLPSNEENKQIHIWHAQEPAPLLKSTAKASEKEQNPSTVLNGRQVSTSQGKHWSSVPSIPHCPGPGAPLALCRQERCHSLISPGCFPRFGRKCHHYRTSLQTGTGIGRVLNCLDCFNYLLIVLTWKRLGSAQVKKKKRQF